MGAQRDLPDRAVVVGVDGSGPSHSALLWAAREAAARSLPLVVCHSYQPAHSGPWEIDGSLRNRAWRIALDAARAAELETPGIEVVPYAALGPVARVLRDAVPDPDLFVLGQHHRSQGRHLMADLLLDGVDADRLARPVVLVQSDAQSMRGHRGRAPILLAIDSANAVEATGPFALAAAALHGTRVEVVPVSRAGDHVTSAALRTFRRLASGSPDVPVTVLHEPHAGGPITQLIRAASRAGLLVGPTGERGLAAWSLARAAIGQAACPVALVPHSPAGTACAGANGSAREPAAMATGPSSERREGPSPLGRTLR
ncbi:universal stress protein [Flindersiella endophytica]